LFCSISNLWASADQPHYDEFSQRSFFFFSSEETKFAGSRLFPVRTLCGVIPCIRMSTITKNWVRAVDYEQLMHGTVFLKRIKVSFFNGRHGSTKWEYQLLIQALFCWPHCFSASWCKNGISSRNISNWHNRVHTAHVNRCFYIVHIFEPTHCIHTIFYSTHTFTYMICILDCIQYIHYSINTIYTFLCIECILFYIIQV
jgi:hypothetical protein